MSRPDLDAGTQRFLAHHYSHTDDLLDGEEASAGSSGRFGADTVCFATCPEGIGWSVPGEDHHAGYRFAEWPHRVRWPAIRAHRATQPQQLLDRLHDVRAAHHAEHRAHWEAMGAIRKSWYSGATDEQRAALDAEWDRHIKADRAHRAAVDAAVLALLPLAIDEPADLIEWAEALQ